MNAEAALCLLDGSISRELPHHRRRKRTSTPLDLHYRGCDRVEIITVIIITTVTACSLSAAVVVVVTVIRGAWQLVAELTWKMAGKPHL